MDETVNKILQNPKYRGQIEKFSDEDLQVVANDEIKALELARKGIAEVEPEKKEDLEYLNAVAHGMQELARLVLEKRSQN